MLKEKISSINPLKAVRMIGLCRNFVTWLQIMLFLE